MICLFTFRLFGNLDQERRRWKSLIALGVADEEWKKAASIQTAVLFFLPLVLAISLSTYALKSISLTVFPGISILQPTIVGVGTILALQILAFCVIKSLYLRQIRMG